MAQCLTRDRRAAGSNLTDVTFQENTAVFFGSCLKEFHSVWNCLFNIITFRLKDVGAICFVVSGSAMPECDFQLPFVLKVFPTSHSTFNPYIKY